MLPIRLSLSTLNLWNTERWPERGEALKKFINLYSPDIICFQELRKETQAYLDDFLISHARIYDDFPGWTCEGNIYWKKSLFEEVQHDTEDIGILEKYRRLFWVRLRMLNIDRTVLVSTAHYTYQRHPNEIESGISPRIPQTNNTISVLKNLTTDPEPIFFLGDLNDPVHPNRILTSSGFTNCFDALGILCPPTFPAFPTANVFSGRSSMTLDWIFANKNSRAILAQVPHIYSGNLSPSDHWPIVAIYEI